MADDVAKHIEAWFAQHVDDGEFTRPERAVPYSVIGPANRAERIIYTTKAAAVSCAIHTSALAEQFGMVGRYGLPSADDLNWIRQLLGARQLLFLGDMDPVDLMIFAWLRASLPPKQVRHLGVNDPFLQSLQLSATACHSLPCATSEVESLPILRQVFPDVMEVVGPECAKILTEGRKIELEAVVSALGTVASLLRPAIEAGN